jgi:hypothetical protein
VTTEDLIEKHRELMAQSRLKLQEAREYQKEADKHLKRAQFWLVLGIIFLAISLGTRVGVMVWKAFNG